MRNILVKLNKNLDNPISMTCVELFDYHFLYDTHKYISACLMATISMVNLAMPHLNVNPKF